MLTDNQFNRTLDIKELSGYERLHTQLESHQEAHRPQELSVCTGPHSYTQGERLPGGFLGTPVSESLEAP